MDQKKFSRGHLGVINGLEYFIFENGDLYRAPFNNPIDINGWRQGARWQAPAHLADSQYQLVIDSVQQ